MIGRDSWLIIRIQSAAGSRINYLGVFTLFRERVCNDFLNPASIAVRSVGVRLEVLIVYGLFNLNMDLLLFGLHRICSGLLNEVRDPAWLFGWCDTRFSRLIKDAASLQKIIS